MSDYIDPRISTYAITATGPDGRNVWVNRNLNKEDADRIALQLQSRGWKSISVFPEGF